MESLTNKKEIDSESQIFEYVYDTLEEDLTDDRLYYDIAIADK